MNGHCWPAYEQSRMDVGGVFTQIIPLQNIPFTFTVQPVDVCATNTEPTTPSLVVNPSAVIVGQETTLTFSATDAQNDPLTYQIDWGDGVLTTVTSPLMKSWTTAGTKTVKIRALDACGESTWTTKTVVVSEPPALGTLTVTANPTC